jgi:hypothetical protein
MAVFQGPRDLRHNRGLIADPALVYLYAGLRSGASADAVLARAEADGPPFTQAEPLKAWVVRGLAELA